jgi:hypothetical protein
MENSKLSQFSEEVVTDEALESIDAGAEVAVNDSWGSFLQGIGGIFGVFGFKLKFWDLRIHVARRAHAGATMGGFGDARAGAGDPVSELKESGFRASLVRTKDRLVIHNQRTRSAL